LPAERIEVDRARHRESEQLTAVDVASRLETAVDRDQLDVVLDQPRVERHAGGTPGLEVLPRRQVHFPALRGDELVVARVGTLRLEIHAGEEIAERQLADHASYLEREVEALRGRPGERGRAFRPPERPDEAVGPGL